ncbi:uncharacterized protein TNCV_4874341 [Trichonephila clavipes]|nr:uncharacterized protein TNCV_4874341 [Trichonephila clavipes]
MVACILERYWLDGSAVENLTAANRKLNKLLAHGGWSDGVATYELAGSYQWMRWNPRSPDAQVIRTAPHAFRTNCQTVEKLFRTEVLKRLPGCFDSSESKCFFSYFVHNMLRSHYDIF